MMRAMGGEGDMHPSPWVTEHIHRVSLGGDVLDLACGEGRHARWLQAQGFRVHALDIREAPIRALQALGIEAECVDLESGHWPPPHHRRYDGIVVTRYLHRPILLALVALLNEGGVLIYETFMREQARYGSPKNPDFLLNDDELHHVYAPHLEIVAFAQISRLQPHPCFMQQLCAIKNLLH